MEQIKSKKFFKNNWQYPLVAFLLPIIIMIGVYLSIGIYWGSERTVLASDAFSQFTNFHASFKNVLSGKQSIFYSWNSALGFNYLSFVSYYLGGLFTPLVLFFDKSQMPDVLYLLTLLKIGFAGLAFWYYSKNTFKISNWAHVMLSIPYALSSFALAHSEIIMWLDTFVFLPLIILGINRIIERKQPTCLFLSYFILFVSNFYMAFMVGVFSFLYYLARLLSAPKKNRQTILPYLITSLSAGIASMIIILPTILDLRSNGEELTKITTLKTEATGFWDLIMKNMVGVFDTTKYGSIPFIYIGLLPLCLCLFYFITKKIALINKLTYAGLFAILIASFYFQPLNLFWHGLHAPNMFLFRYSFVFSFLVIMLAGYGWEKFTKDDLGLLTGTMIVTIAIFTLAKVMTSKNGYTYVTDQSFYLTILFLALYLISIIFYQLKHIGKSKLVILLLLLVSIEATINTSGMLNGVLEDWNYPSRSLYTLPYSSIKKLVDQTKTENKNEFYRLENLDPVSSNDSLNYGYNGVSFFSSIRNRNSSSLLDQLGFRSRGTNLNIRYDNNTLLMDSLIGIKYNISKTVPMKSGYDFVSSANNYSLYKNENALPLGILTDSGVYDLKLLENDNLGSQTVLYNYLSKSTNSYYSLTTPTIVSQANVNIIRSTDNTVTYKEVSENVAKDITWQVHVPAGKQAYLSLFPTNFSQLESSTATITVNGQSKKSQISITGQYYNLGYYDQDTTVTFTASFYGTTEVSFVDPPVVLLDLDAFQTDTNSIKENGVDLKVGKRTASATINTEKSSVLFTTIPYDKGWKAYIDGKQVKVSSFQDAFLTVNIPKGKHVLKLVFLPQGFKIGVICFFAGIITFMLYRFYKPLKIYVRKKFKFKQ